MYGARIDQVCGAMAGHPRTMAYHYTSERAGRDPRSQGEGLGSLLARPVGRLREYARLIDGVLRYLPTGHCY